MVPYQKRASNNIVKSAGKFWWNVIKKKGYLLDDWFHNFWKETFLKDVLKGQFDLVLTCQKR